jgi:hypothetical protein
VSASGNIREDRVRVGEVEVTDSDGVTRVVIRAARIRGARMFIDAEGCADVIPPVMRAEIRRWLDSADPTSDDPEVTA